MPRVLHRSVGTDYPVRASRAFDCKLRRPEPTAFSQAPNMSSGKHSLISSFEHMPAHRTQRRSEAC